MPNPMTQIQEPITSSPDIAVSNNKRDLEFCLGPCKVYDVVTQCALVKMHRLWLVTFHILKANHISMNAHKEHISWRFI